MDVGVVRRFSSPNYLLGMQNARECCSLMKSSSLQAEWFGSKSYCHNAVFGKEGYKIINQERPVGPDGKIVDCMMMCICKLRDKNDINDLPDLLSFSWIRKDGLLCSTCLSNSTTISSISFMHIIRRERWSMLTWAISMFRTWRRHVPKR